MRVKTYRAESLQSALQMVRSDLGPDASVLETKRVWDSAIGRILRLDQVEVTASCEIQVPSLFDNVDRTRALDVGLDITELEAESLGSVGSTPAEESFGLHDNLDACERLESMEPPPPAPLADRVAKLRNDSQCLTELSPSHIQVCSDLVHADVDEATARQFVQATLTEGAASLEEIHDQVRSQIADEIPIQGPIRLKEGVQKIVALVGPTGVGKTTTIAKLAANFRLKDKLNVGLITADTFRIAAVDQLQTYADIIDLPMEVVSTTRELREAMTRLASLDLILMDTAGRSPQSDSDIEDLQSLLSVAQPHEVHLVLSATSGIKSLVRATERFASVGTTSMLLTKLDESPGLGNLLPLWRNVALPISYVTNGQNVPDDIRGAEASWLTQQILPSPASDQQSLQRVEYPVHDETTENAA